MIKTIGLFLLMLLKILGGLLLVLLLVLTVALLLVSFVPVRYDILVQNEKTADPNPVKNIRVQVKVSWLVHLIHVTVSYGPEGLANKIKAAGIDVQKALAWFANRKEARRSRRKARKQKKSEKAGKSEQEQSTGTNVSQNHAKESESTGDSTETRQEQDSENSQPEQPFAQQDLENIQPEVQQGQSAEEQDLNTADSGDESGKNTAKQKKRRRKKKPGKDFPKKAFRKKKPHKNPEAEKKESHAGKLSSIREKFRQVYKEYKDETNRHAVSQLWKELCRLLRNYKPRKLKADLTFSLSDPALTGNVLGIISLMPAVYRYPCSIIPDFESDKLYMEGSLRIQGKVTLYVFLFSLLRLIRDKEFMKTVKKLMKRG